ncbi:ABC transporter substrate-binding protein [Pseudogracilibacillus auburnensis]|uniref:Iron complex transport system substrate-binding protein n=1 Tax=Pseudogracilibacillus auburnensis TaxID=1494959 RepID=A0A2V3VUR9_9BACI|nr:ABC transporter substrate-binding protein [Pseudogracilibacillus auburnensis]MBO1004053.1 ABC transporter substrate-binding protein [Pseudogracilibacillus auburnensis]PXW85657.1 iron complex transport system substrate-binding protein [Pseudogracilibacillus auburnensis]
MKKAVIVFCSMLVFLMVGCSSNTDETTNQGKTKEAGENAISITDFSNRTITFDHIPEKIVSLGNGETDIIYALGEEVVGRPTGDAVIKESENALEVGSSHSADLEKITSLDPDVVLGNHPMNSNDVQSIESIGSEMILTSANSVDDIKKQITLFSDLLNKREKADEVIHMIDEKIAQIQSEQTEKKPRVLLVYGAPGTNMAALPNSLSGDILELAGGENIASDYPSLEMYPQYAQLNTERMIESNPQMILLMSHGNPEEVKEGFINDMSKNAGWNELDAVKNDQFIILPHDLFGTNPGTKIVDALDYLHELLQDVKE